MVDLALLILVVAVFALQFVWGYLKFKFVPWILPIIIAGLFLYTIFTGQVKGLMDVLRPLLTLMMSLGIFGSGIDYRDKRMARKAQAEKVE